MIPFRRDFEFAYGECRTVSPLIRRIVARNPGRFTGPGTGTLLIGHDDVAIVDPGPNRDDHFEAINAALSGQKLTHVFVTHSHMDHSALARRLADHHGAALLGRGGAVTDEDAGASRLEAGDDSGFRPDKHLVDGERFEGGGWTIEALHTPGHTAGHFCFAIEQEGALLCGDHVMAWSTSVVSPPDGHMGDYVSSLERILRRRFKRLIPTHGPAVEDPEPYLQAYIQHRRQRRAEVLERLLAGETTIKRIVASIYTELDPALRPAAALSVWAHLIDLVEGGYATAAPAPTLAADYAVAYMEP